MFIIFKQHSLFVLSVGGAGGRVEPVAEWNVLHPLREGDRREPIVNLIYSITLVD